MAYETGFKSSGLKQKQNMQEDDYSADSSTDSLGDHGNNHDANDEEEVVIAKAESKAVFWWKLIVLSVLLASALGVAVSVYMYTTDSETNDFEEQFNNDAIKIFETVGSTLDISLGTIDSFLVTLTSFARFTNMTWPFVTIPDYYVRTAKILSLSKAFVCSQYHFIQTEQRAEWENYSFTHDGWVSEGLHMQKTDPFFKGTLLDTYVKSPIYVYDVIDKPLVPQGYFPSWQTSPVVPITPPYNWEGYSYNPLKYALPHLLDLQVVISQVANPKPNVSDPSQVENFDGVVAWAKDYIQEGEDPTEPFSEIQYPILRDSSEHLNYLAATSNETTHPVVGVFSVTFFWRHLITDILSKSSQGMICVIGNECGQMFTYEINGPEVKYVGDGDLHDSRYDYLERFSYFLDLRKARSNQRGYTGLPLSTDYCPYWIRVYPSVRTEDTHTSHDPIIFTVSAIIIFLFTSLVFVIYDVCVERRQRKVMKTAVQSTAIVTSLFPSNVRDRLFPLEEEKGPSGKRQQKHATFKNDGSQQQQPNESTDKKLSSRPVADLFPEATVLFSDIAGFTAWSSVREPSQVFILLESIYGAFDAIAKRRGVFKVETVGDSYIAVKGLPEPCRDHALVMAKFARDCREKFNDVVKDLELTLGPDTGDLQMRFGLNSGPVTAGVLRGEKGRFQLFGDTVNTAARMESNGMRNRIQVSQSTADLLIAAGKAHWVTKREDLVQAKGKGQMQTYWVEPTSSDIMTTTSHTTGPPVDNTLFENTLDDRIVRLVDWQVEVLSKLIRQIIARRTIISVEQAPVMAAATLVRSISSQGTTVLDEVKDVIEMPDFDARASLKQQDVESIELSSEIVEQLHEYVQTIAGAYHRNPFHNFEHAAHVTMSVVKLLSRITASDESNNKDNGLPEHDHAYGITDPLTQFACVLSALIHDVDHQGVPNMQLVKEQAYIASAYKNRSVAEQNSFDISWNLFMDERFEALRNAICQTPGELARLRQLVVNSVMATDIMDKDLKTLRIERWERAFLKTSTDSSKENRDRKATIVIEHLIQASDIAHTMQHWHVYRKWNERLFEEMLLAYQHGRADKDPCESWYAAEIGFFDFYIIPLAKKLRDCGVFGVSSQEYLDYANKNRAEWEIKGKEVVASMIEKLSKKNK